MSKIIVNHISIGIDATTKEALTRLKSEGYSVNKLIRKLILEFAMTKEGEKDGK